MIAYCPHCGHSLHHAIVHGITSCSNCNRVFSSTPFNRLLSASWLARRKGISCEEALIAQGYTEEEACLVVTYVVDQGFTQEEFVAVLKERGVNENYIDQVS